MTQRDERIGEAPPLRKRGAQPGNTNALRHGKWSGATMIRRKLSVARLRALAHVIQESELALSIGRYRVGPLRQDQTALLRALDPQLLGLVPRRYLHRARAAAAMDDD